MLSQLAGGGWLKHEKVRDENRKRSWDWRGTGNRGGNERWRVTEFVREEKMSGEGGKWGNKTKGLRRGGGCSLTKWRWIVGMTVGCWGSLAVILEMLISHKEWSCCVPGCKLHKWINIPVSTFYSPWQHCRHPAVHPIITRRFPSNSQEKLKKQYDLSSGLWQNKPFAEDQAKLWQMINTHTSLCVCFLTSCHAHPLCFPAASINNVLLAAKSDDFRYFILHVLIVTTCHVIWVSM